MSVDQERLATKKAAAYLGISPRTLEKYRVIGGGPTFIKIFARVVYDRRDLDAWLLQCRRTSTSASPASPVWGVR